MKKSVWDVVLYLVGMGYCGCTLYVDKGSFGGREYNRLEYSATGTCHHRYDTMVS